MFEPSKEWTAEDRLKVIAGISDRLVSWSHQREVPRAVIYDTAERINSAATKPAAFLEDNRKSILEGQLEWMIHQIANES